jgi:LacI family transcriptional regulator
MKTQVTLKQVAKAAGVHFSTVSRALNPATRDRVTPAVATRVLEVANKLGYRANGIASSLRTRRSRVVGFVVPDIGSLLFPPILEGIEHTLLEQGYMTIIGNTANDPERHRNVLARMIERQVDGLILATATLRDRTVEEWVERRAPLVLINRTDTSGRAPAVINDDVRGIGLAVAHLAGLGHRRIGHIAGPQHLSTGAQRLRGFETGMAEHNITVAPARVVIAASFRRDTGRTACEQLLDHNSDLTAIVAANDLLALGCYDALKARGLNCPRDISVTGYNDTPLVDLVMPPLTTIRISQRDMGIEAARLLLKRMEQMESAPGDVLMRPELVVRQSTAAAGAV